MKPERDARGKTNRSLTAKLFMFALGSFGFGFALVPLYNVLCAVTGQGDQSALARAAVVTEHPDLSRLVTVDFLTDVAANGNWEFHPVVKTIQVHPGQLYLTHFYAHNLMGHDTVGAGRTEYLALEGGGLVSQDRVFLLLAAAFHRQRGTGDAGALLRRSGAAEVHRSSDAGVHVLRFLDNDQTREMTMAQAHAPDTSHYYVPHDSHWPIVGRSRCSRSWRAR